MPEHERIRQAAMIAGESKDDQSFGRAKSACHLKSHEPGVVNDWDNRSTLDARFIPRGFVQFTSTIAAQDAMFHLFQIRQQAIAFVRQVTNSQK